MTEMVFFDIGDVLFDENPQHEFLFHTLLMTLRRHGKEVSWDAWDTNRKRLVAAGPNPQAAIREALAACCTDDSETDRLWQEAFAPYHEMRRPRPYGFLLDGITAVLEDLRADFRLGIVANQHAPVLAGIEDYGIAPLFDVIVISESVGLAKPDPAIFQYGLDQAGLAGSAALFVGDRPDNDVRPAKALGMKTVRFRRGIQYVHYNPDDPAQTADETVETVGELAAAIRRVAGTEDGNRDH